MPSERGFPGALVAVASLLAIAVGGCEGGAGLRTSEEGQVSRRSTVEIRSYNLEPGVRETFHRLVVDEGLPLLRRHDVDVVGFGPSPHDETSYVLIRAFESMADRRRTEEALYGSEAWREGPRDEVLAMIESYTTVVLELDSMAVEGLRAATARDP